MKGIVMRSHLPAVALVTVPLALLLAAAFAQEHKPSPNQPGKTSVGSTPIAPAPAGQDAPKPASQPESGSTTKPASGSQDMPPEMKAALETMKPGPAHEKLARLAGEWTTKTRLAGGGAPAEETEGTAKIRLVLDGRFIHEDDSGTMLGMPFNGARLLGYNNGSRKYEGVWTYTLGTGMMFLNGTSTDDGRTIKCSAAFDNEIGIKETMDIIYRFTDDDHFMVVLEAGKMPDGSPGPRMETTYSRKK
jgi:hypothetical protein